MIDAPDLDAAWEAIEKPEATDGGPLLGISLPSVFEAVKKALEGNGQARQAVGQMLMVLSAPEAPQVWHEFAAFLAQVLQGNRNIQQLTEGISSPDLAAAIREFVEKLGAETR